jgi:hypothetical protein
LEDRPWKFEIQLVMSLVYGVLLSFSDSSLSNNQDQNSLKVDGEKMSDDNQEKGKWVQKTWAINRPF